MEYIYHRGDFLTEYFKSNKITKEDLDIFLFDKKLDNDNLNSFKDKIIEFKDKKFLIVGDYDCDGICATAIINKLFDYLNINHNFYIPSRSKDGYGLNMNIIDNAINNNFEVILTLDNGVAAFDEIKYARAHGLKVLVLDHHEISDEVICDGFIHPTLLPKGYDSLSAGGLAYLLSSLFYDDELSLVYGGLAVLGDMVGVLGYNRYLIKKTLEILKKGNIYQINLLNGSNKYDDYSLSFNVIPKINAISRMDYNPNILVKYLLADYNDCLMTIKDIDKVNKERKELSDKLTKSAYERINEEDKVILLIGEEYKEGICGVLANKIMKTMDKPVIILNSNEGLLKGSARSPEGINIYEYLDNIKDIFETFGGHEAACGLSLKEDNLSKLTDYINSSMWEYKPIKKDVYIMDINDMNYDLVLKLEDLKPFGTDLQEPLLMIEDVKYENKLLVANKYSKYILNNKLSAISFKNSDINKEFNSLIGYLRKDNYYKNNSSLIIEDFI